jgi:hypothetical protein
MKEVKLTNVSSGLERAKHALTVYNHKHIAKSADKSESFQTSLHCPTALKVDQGSGKGVRGKHTKVTYALKLDHQKRIQHLAFGHSLRWPFYRDLLMNPSSPTPRYDAQPESNSTPSMSRFRCPLPCQQKTLNHIGKPSYHVARTTLGLSTTTTSHTERESTSLATGISFIIHTCHLIHV